MSEALEWGRNERTHTFSTGRSATLRRTVNVFAVVTETGVDIDDPRDSTITTGEVVLGILRYLWVSPVVLGPGEAPPDDETPSVSFADIDTQEVVESLEVWKEAAANAARFRGDAAGVGGGADGEGVGDDAKPAPRSRRRVAGSAAR